MDEYLLYNAKNNQLTCSVNKINIHSSYNPETEASRFVSSIQKTFNPSCIIITEPALSYCSTYLKKEFPNAKLIAIRYTNFFDKWNFNWDKVLYYKDLSEELLLSILKEEELYSTLFLSWPPSVNIYKEKEEKTWKIFKNVFIRAKTVLFTRSYFSTRWIINTVNFIKYANNFYKIEKANQDILICASGLSLENSIKKIKQHKNNFFVIALSSSVNYLLNNNIIPDLVFSTDGGYWAKKHLDVLKKYDIPIALTNEANISKKLYSKKIVPFYYKDSVSSKILELTNIPFLLAEPNGTVSGTALKASLNMTTKNIYFCGLDLSNSKGFQHSKPNKLEIINSTFDNKIKNKQTRLYKAELQTESLDIYKNWFIENSKYFNNRVYRLSDNYKFNNNLGFIKDINFEEINYSKDTSKIKITSISVEKNKININKIKNILLEDNSIKEIFPVEYLSYQKELDDKAKESKKEILNKKILDLVNKVEKILNE